MAAEICPALVGLAPGPRPSHVNRTTYGSSFRLWSWLMEIGRCLDLVFNKEGWDLCGAHRMSHSDMGKAVQELRSYIRHPKFASTQACSLCYGSYAVVFECCLPGYYATVNG